MEIEGYFTSTAFLSTSSPTHDPYLTTLNDGQEILMSILGLISAGLSVIGSSLIVLRVLRKFSCQCWRRREEGTTAPVATPVTVTPYDRLMLGLSTSDLISSITFGIGPFLLPADSSPRAWAAGTDATCTTLGFFYQLSFLSVAYNGILSLYYLLTVRMGVKRVDFAKRYEPWLHGLAILYFVTTASVGLGIGLYSELVITQGCWIGEYPENCTATGNCISTMIGWIYGGIPFLVVFLGLPIINLSIYRFVRNQFSEKGNGVGVGGVPMVTTPREEAQKLRVREVAHQGFLYVAFFYVAYTPAFLVRVFEGMGMKGEEEENIYWLLVLNSMLLPLQGWFNFFIYMRPNYIRVRKAYPEESRWWALQLCILEQDLPTLLESRDLYSTDQKSFSSTNRRSNQPRSNGAANSATKSIEILDSIREGDNESTRSRHSRGNIDYSTSTSEDDEEHDREGGLFASTRTSAQTNRHIQMDGSILQSPTKSSHSKRHIPNKEGPVENDAPEPLIPHKDSDRSPAAAVESTSPAPAAPSRKKSQVLRSKRQPKAVPILDKSSWVQLDTTAVESTSPAPAAPSRKKSQVLRPKRQPKAVTILDNSSWAQLDTTEAGYGAGGDMGGDDDETSADEQRKEEALLRIIQRRKLVAQEQLEKNRRRAAQSPRP